MNKTCIALLLFISTSSFSATKNQDVAVKNCLSAREYITTLEFLRDFEELKITEKNAQRHADLISQGCSGAGQRFIKIVKLLISVGVDSNSSLKSGLSFTNQEDEVVDAFVETFSLAYESDFLDLDALSAMKISLSLSSKFKGNPKIAREDFKKIALYCKDKNKLDLPLPTCAKMATNISLLSEKFNKGLSQSFINLFEFMTESDKGPQNDLKSAFNISKDLIKYGPKVDKNFKQSYIYGVSKSGLKLSASDAFKFAIKMAKRSYKNLESPK